MVVVVVQIVESQVANPGGRQVPVHVCGSGRQARKRACRPQVVPSKQNPPVLRGRRYDRCSSYMVRRVPYPVYPKSRSRQAGGPRQAGGRRKPRR